MSKPRFNLKNNKICFQIQHFFKWNLHISFLLVSEKNTFDVFRWDVLLTEFQNYIVKNNYIECNAQAPSASHGHVPQMALTMSTWHVYRERDSTGTRSLRGSHQGVLFPNCLCVMLPTKQQSADSRSCNRSFLRTKSSALYLVRFCLIFFRVWRSRAHISSRSLLTVKSNVNKTKI